MATDNYLAVDLGAESGRTIVGRFNGKRIKLKPTHRFPNGPVHVLDTLHWDVLRLWSEIKTGIGKSVATCGRMASIGVDTWGVDFGFVASDGSLVANPVHYRDRRTDGMLERAFAKLSRVEMSKADVYDITGLQFMKFNSLFQLLAIKERAVSDPFATVHRLLFMPDLFHYFLSGEMCSEYTIASTSQMLDARTRTWSKRLLRALGIPVRMLSPLCATGSRLGPLRADVAAETGSAGTDVIATAGHDTAAAVAAVPATGSNWCYISSGTWSLMGVELSSPCITSRSLAANFTNEGGVAGTTRFLKNIMGLWLVQECRRCFERAGHKHDYATLAWLADKEPRMGPIVDPDHEGFIRPDDMVRAIQAFCKSTDQDPPETHGAIIRCCLESLALRYRWVLEMIQAILVKRIETIHIVGGGSQNELLCELTADCCGRPVVTGPVEATAMGNCLVQAMGRERIGTLAELREIARNSTKLRTYEPRHTAGWDEQFGRFCKLLKARV